MQLRDMTRSKANCDGIKAGDIVLLIDEQITPRSWPMAIVDEVIPTRSSNKARSVFTNDSSTRGYSSFFWSKRIFG